MTKEDRRYIKNKFGIWALFGDKDIDDYIWTLDAYARNFIWLRFKDRYSIIAISFVLHMSERQVYRVQAKIFNGLYDRLVSANKIEKEGA